VPFFIPCERAVKVTATCWRRERKEMATPGFAVQGPTGPSEAIDAIKRRDTWCLSRRAVYGRPKLGNPGAAERWAKRSTTGIGAGPLQPEDHCCTDCSRSAWISAGVFGRSFNEERATYFELDWAVASCCGRGTRGEDSGAKKNDMVLVGQLPFNSRRISEMGGALCGRNGREKLCPPEETCFREE